MGRAKGKWLCPFSMVCFWQGGRFTKLLQFDLAQHLSDFAVDGERCFVIIAGDIEIDDDETIALIEI